MRVAVFGGTGFIGGYMVDALRAAGHEVVLLVREGTSVPDGVESVEGDIADRGAIARVVDSADAVIYLIGILRESRREGVTFEEMQFNGVVRVAEAAERAGVKRFLHMSANGVEARTTAYQRTKHDAEQLLADGRFDLTVFRPSVVFGDPRGRMEFATQLYRDMIRPPLPAVVFHTGWRPSQGAVCMSPVHVTDVAAAFSEALQEAGTVGEVFELGGPETLSWGEMLSRIAATVGRSKLMLPMPLGMMKIAATALDWLPVFPVTRDQLVMLAQGNVAGSERLKSLIGRPATGFDTESLSYLRAKRSETNAHRADTES